MTSDDRNVLSAKKSRILAVALVACAALLAPAIVPAAASGRFSIAIVIGLIVVACIAMAVRLGWPRRTRDGN